MKTFLSHFLVPVIPPGCPMTQGVVVKSVWLTFSAKLFQSFACGQDMELTVRIQAALVRGNLQGQVIDCGHCSTKKHFSVPTRTCGLLLFLPDSAGSSLWEVSYRIYLLLSALLLTSLKYWWQIFFLPPVRKKIFFTFYGQLKEDGCTEFSQSQHKEEEERGTWT